MNYMLYYSNRCQRSDMLDMVACRIIEQAARLGFLLVASLGKGVNHSGIRWADTVVHQPDVPLPVGIFTAIQSGLKAIRDDDATVYCCEDDVIYPDSYFAPHAAHEYQVKGVDPSKAWCYDVNVVSLCERGFFYHLGLTKRSAWLSASWCRAGLMREIVAAKIRELSDPANTNYIYEPGPRTGFPMQTVCGAVPVIDIRHGRNSTWQPSGTEKFYNWVPGWPYANDLIEQYLIKTEKA